jgi:hypothetical protein
MSELAALRERMLNKPGKGLSPREQALRRIHNQREKPPAPALSLFNPAK